MAIIYDMGSKVYSIDEEQQTGGQRVVRRCTCVEAHDAVGPRSRARMATWRDAAVAAAAQVFFQPHLHPLFDD